MQSPRYFCDAPVFLCHGQQQAMSKLGTRHFPRSRVCGRQQCELGSAPSFSAAGWPATARTAGCPGTCPMVGGLRLVATIWAHSMLPADAKSLPLCLTLCDPMDCSLPGSSVHGILQARTLEWVAIFISRGSS